MQSTDREEFKSQLGKFCAGFNVPMTPEREEAYWSGLTRMTLVQFVRSVEHALGPDGPDKFPTTGQVWKTLRALRQPAPSDAPAAADTRDHLLYFANRIFFAFLTQRGGLGPAKLLACRKVVLETVAYFTEPVLEGDVDATPFAFVSALVKGLQSVTTVPHATLVGLRELCQKPDARDPFVPAMARPVPEFNTPRGVPHAHAD